MLAGVGDVLRDFRQKIQGIENLEIALEGALIIESACPEPVEAAWQRKGPRVRVFFTSSSISPASNWMEDTPNRPGSWRKWARETPANSAACPDDNFPVSNSFTAIASRGACALGMPLSAHWATTQGRPYNVFLMRNHLLPCV